MGILILDGTFGSKYSGLLNRITNQLDSQDIEVIKIEDSKVAYCTGCWSCWVKTPGKCVHQDHTQVILNKAINADKVLLFTENSVGYITSLSKKVLEKFIPLVHPYIELVDGECHHVKRYESYPEMGLIYIDDALNESDYQNTRKMIERAALNFKTTLSLSLHIKSDEEAFSHEIIHF